MGKKLIKLSDFYVLFLFMVLISAFVLYFQFIFGIVSFILTFISFILVLYYTKNKNIEYEEDIRKYKDSLDNIASEVVYKMPFPVAVLNNKGRVKWYSPEFSELFSGSDIIGIDINSEISSFNITEVLKKGYGKVNWETKKFNYLVYYNVVKDEDNGDVNVIIYLIDNLAYSKLKKQYEEETLNSIVIYIDNYEDVRNNVKEDFKAILIAEMDKIIINYFSSLGAIIRKYDSGKYIVISNDIILQKIKAQADVAMENADVILFVVDGKSGLMDEDREISNYLRRTKKPVVLAVNKVDTHKMPAEVYEFYELGFENLNIISATQGFGLGDLLDEIIKEFPENKYTGEEDEVTKIALIGKPNVGKSSLMNRILGEERMIVSDIAGTTRDSIDSRVEIDGKTYIFTDTAGLRRKRNITENLERYSVVRTLNAVERSDIAILLIDATEGVTEQDTKVIGFAKEQNKALIIAVNKWDLIVKDNKTYKAFEDDIRTKLSFVPYAQLVFISVKTGQRIDKLFEAIKIADENYSTRISTGILNDIINDAVVHNSPPTDKGQRLKIFYASQVSVRPPKFVIFVNKVELMHFSYLRYLENQIRKNFSFTSSPIVFELRARGEENV